MPNRILIADDHPLVREALSAAVRSVWPDCVIDEAASIAEAEALAAARRGHMLVTLDLMLPDANGFSGLLMLQKLLPGAPIAIVSARQDPQAISTAYLLDAAAFLSKSMPMTQIAEALRRTAQGERVFPPSPPSRPAAAAATSRQLNTLSAAQLRILLALADGRLNKHIAADMNLTEATVKAHLTAIFKKLGVHNRTQAILAAQPLLSIPSG